MAMTEALRDSGRIAREMMEGEEAIDLVSSFSINHV